MRPFRGLIAGLFIPLLLLSGCYFIRGTEGGGQAEFDAPRDIDPDDVALPEGYRIEAVAANLTYPTGVAFDDQGGVYVVESGYSYGEDWTEPRLLQIGDNGQFRQIARGDSDGPWTAVTFHDGDFFISSGNVLHGGRILRISPDGRMRAIVEDLPSYGDHHTNGATAGPGGWIYFGQGTATNSGVVGPDNAEFGWLHRFPGFHDIPGQDIVLSGVNYTSENPLTPEDDEVTTGAYVPFGTPTEPGQVIPGRLPCNGSIMRVRPDGSGLELVAWGFRNPFGLAFTADGQLYCTDNMYDLRGSRPLFGAGDLLWKVESGKWYGWPDFHGHHKLTMDERYKPQGDDPVQALLAEPPNEPPDPAAILAVHSSSDGFDFSRNPAFGYVGQAFIAQLGDETPGTGKVFDPVGFKVVRVEVDEGIIHDFAVNRGDHNGPASFLNRGGLERPVACRFDPSGTALYVVDFGVLLQDEAGPHPQPNTGVLWRITSASHQRDQAGR
ncbi:MAG: glucose dehydrogenase [Candidatus Zixiibacteriota bacterium]|nr:MAG: glucose dehydrogenase [candidate division Zixibacteria bacterium]